MLGKYKTDWLGLGVIVLAVALFFGPVQVGVQPVALAQTGPTIAAIAWTANSGATNGHLIAAYSDGSREEWYYNAGSSNNWTWYTYPANAMCTALQSLQWNSSFVMWQQVGGSACSGPCSAVNPAYGGAANGQTQTVPCAYGSYTASGNGTPSASLMSDSHFPAAEGSQATYLWSVLNPGVALPSDGAIGMLHSYLAAPGSNCGTVYSGFVDGVGANPDWTQPFQTWACVNGVHTQTGSGNCSRAGCSGPVIGWDGQRMPAGWVGCQTCSGGGGCTGTITWTAGQDLTWVQTGGTCSTGCNPVCPGVAPTNSGQTASTSCSTAATGTCASGTPPCTGGATWTASVAQDGTISWSLASNTCSGGASGCYPVCPGSAPSSGSSTASTGCSSSSTGTCPTKAPTCTGNCNYTAVLADDTDATKGYKWSLAGNNCSTGSNCNCPARPGGACPTALRQNKSIACGSADGGDCTGNTVGSCNNSCVFKWYASTAINSQPSATVCAWQVVVEQNAGKTTYTWSGGKSGTDCPDCTCNTPPLMDARTAYESGNAYVVLAPDGVRANDGTGRWNKESGDCGTTCECVAPTTSGTTDGQTQTVQCTTKSASCNCSFSWAAVRTELGAILQSRLGVALSRGDMSPLCISFSIPIFNTTYANHFCTSYPNPVDTAQTIFETVRAFVRGGLKAMAWWQFVTWLFNYLSSGW